MHVKRVSVFTSTSAWTLRGSGLLHSGQVGLKKYAAVSPRAFGLGGRKRLAVIRAAGAIVGGSGSPCAPPPPVLTDSIFFRIFWLFFFLLIMEHSWGDMPDVCSKLLHEGDLRSSSVRMHATIWILFTSFIIICYEFLS
jgi:hypothetical protein